MRTGDRVAKANTGTGRDRYEIAIVAMLLIASSVPALQIKYTFENNAGATALREFIWLCTYIFAACRVVGLWSKARTLAPQAALIFAYCGLALVSTAWSIDPIRTLFNAIELCGSALFGFYLVLRFPLPTLLRIFAVKLSVFAVGSYFLIFFSPARGRDDWGAGPWSGIFFDKNALAGDAVITLLVLLSLWPTSAKNRALVLLGAVPFVILLVFSRSATALSAGLGMFAVIAVVLVWRSKRVANSVRFAVAGFIVVAGAAIVVFGITPESVLGLLGRNASLTGRTDFWPYLAQAVADRPVLGYGYAAFFHSDIGNQYLANFLEQSGGWYPYYAHNSFYQVALDLGFAGVALALVILAVVCFRVFRYSITVLQPSSIWPLGIFLYIIFSSYTESTFGMSNTDQWVMLVAAALYPVDGRSAVQGFFVPTTPSRVRVRPRAPTPGA
jgi:O-antigen ligase